MEGIEHRTLSVNGIAMHVAEKGRGGPAVLLLHGFPELWYAWRRQIHALASLGYRAVAPDLRGYGDTEAPAPAERYTCHHVVGDLVALMDELGEEKVHVVGHDLGALVGWYLCMFRPERVRSYVCLTVPFRPRHPRMKPVESMRALFGDDYYICRFQKPGDIESEIERIGARNMLRKILTERKPGPPMWPKGEDVGVGPGKPVALPSWLTEEDLDYYTSKFGKRGFTGGLNYYRAMDLNWELTAPWTGVQVKVPVKFIVGDLDMTYTSPGVKEYVHGGGFKMDVPLLEDVVVMEGAGHFINQERAAEINSHIHDFIKKF
ncbi:epoxide hydrolase A [Rhodamnia argentea]|uniref:soluble epoxide hydrolase n=1 Tax=Rhodamnia argentea TaxID=178133 RepID=A0A8B8QCF2_9MYRT|nr:epoxide hydrolase A [Rhodamnia argentea]